MTSRDLLEHVDDLLAPSLGQQLAFIERAAAKGAVREIPLFTDIADVVRRGRMTVRDLGTQPMRDQLAAAEEARAKADRVCDELAGTADELRKEVMRERDKARQYEIHARNVDERLRLLASSKEPPKRTYDSVYDVYDAVEEVLGELADLSPEERAYAPDPQRHPRLCGRLGVAPAKEVSMRYAGAATSALIAGNIMSRK